MKPTARAICEIGAALSRNSCAARFILYSRRYAEKVQQKFCLNSR